MSDVIARANLLVSEKVLRRFVILIEAHFIYRSVEKIAFRGKPVRRPVRRDRRRPPYFLYLAWPDLPSAVFMVNVMVASPPTGAFASP